MRFELELAEFLLKLGFNVEQIIVVFKVIEKGGEFSDALKKADRLTIK